MADPQASVVITGKDEASTAFDRSMQSMREWVKELGTQANKGKSSFDELRSSLSFVNQALDGFGVTSIVNKIQGIATGAYDAATGLGQFVLDAKAAGAAIGDELTRKAESSSAAVLRMESDIKWAGATLAGPFLDDVKQASEGVSEWIRSNTQEVKEFARFLRDDLVGVVKGLLGPLGLLADAIALPFTLIGKAAQAEGRMAGERPSTSLGEKAQGREDEIEAVRKRRQERAKFESRFDEQFMPKEDFSVDAMMRDADAMEAAERKKAEQAEEAARRKAERDAENKRQAEERERLHLAKLTEETSRWYEQELLNEEIRAAQKVERETLRNAAEAERQRLYAEQVMISTAVGYEQRLAAIEAWETRETEMVGKNEEARKRIQQKAQKDRNDLVNEERLKRLQMQAAAFGGLHSLAVSAGIKSHALEKAAVLSRAMLSLQEWKMKTAAQGGLKGFALIAAVASIAAPIISSIKGSTPFGGADTGGGGGFGGSFSVPDAPIPSLAAPSPVSQPVQAPGAQVVQYITIQGSVVTAQQIHEESLRYAEQAGADGRTTLVVSR